MRLFPAIDILDKKSVRLLYGKRDKVTVYGDPVEMIAKWSGMGAKQIHIVDLNGAFDNSRVNEDILKQIRAEVNITLQIGGGIRDLTRVQYILDELGFDRVIIGSALVTTPKMAEQAGRLYGNRIVAGLDAIDNKLKIKGWVEETEKTPLDVALALKEFGIEDIVFTDISRDGALTGINIGATVKLQEESKMQIIASGGLRGYEDILQLAEKKIYGAILGKAMYEGKIDLKEALALC